MSACLLLGITPTEARGLTLEQLAIAAQLRYPRQKRRR
jgi:hypothetical protein